MTASLVSVLIVLMAAVIKGAIGFGFPTFSTPLLALFIPVKSAVVLLILPNIVMDMVQASRQGGLVATARRFALLVVCGGIGTLAGTHLLSVLSPRIALLILGITVVTFVTLNATRWAPRVPPSAARWLDAPVGFIAGVIGGVTNVPGTPLVIYFYALGLAKPDFVRAIAVTFVLYKVFQLGAVAWYGLLTWRLFGLSVVLSVVAMAGFRVGLAIQDRLDQRTFNRAILVILALLGSWLIVRALV
jgi:uncharacterized protein